MREFKDENKEMTYLVKRFMNMYKRKEQDRQKPFIRIKQVQKE